MTVRIIEGDALAVLRTLESESVQVCVTSPPYFQLRDYQVAGQIGLEPTPAAFIAALLDIFDEVKRVLRPDGLAFVNLGDSYAGSGKGPTGHNGIGDQRRRQGFIPGEGGNQNGSRNRDGLGTIEGAKPKDLLLMPERFAIGMQDRGWWVRSRIAWCKTSAMPESVRDRPTSAWEHIWMFSKSRTYYYDADAVAQPSKSTHPSGNGYKRPERLSINGRGSDEPWQVQPTSSLRNYWLLGPEPNSETIHVTRRVQVSSDEADGGTERIASPDCPRHAPRVWSGISRTPGCDERRDQLLTGTVDTSSHLDLEPSFVGASMPPDSSVSVGSSSLSRTEHDSRPSTPCDRGPQPAEPRNRLHTGDTSGTPVDSSDSPVLEGSPIANSRSTEIHRTAPDLETSSLGMPSAETTDDTDDTSASPLFEQPRLDIAESNSETVGSGVRPSLHTGNGTADIPSVPRASEPCTCTYWRDATESISHYAGFPTELPKRCILAGTSEKGACIECGALWVRVVERESVGRTLNGGRAGFRVDEIKAVADKGASSAGFVNSREVGWRSTCLCLTTETRPCVVLDPFLGSGTTLMVASRLGRDGVGVELNPAYVKLARDRIDRDAGTLFPEEITVTASQSSLFDDAEVAG